MTTLPRILRIAHIHDEYTMTIGYGEPGPHTEAGVIYIVPIEEAAYTRLQGLGVPST